MARSITEIQNEIIAAKNAEPSLANLNSPSATAHWRLWTYVVASAIWTLENLWDLFKKDIESIAATAVYGSDPWWVDKAFEFQYGDDLQIVTVNGVKVPKYASIDDTKKIIKRASIRAGSNGNAFLKVAKEISGEITPLDNFELAAFTSYIEKLRPAGANITVASNASDIAKFYLSIYYNPLLDLDTIKENVKAAINEYLANISFDGQVMLSKLIDAIQQVEGVVDVLLNSAEAKPAAGDYVLFNRIYQTASGYINIDPDYSLDDTLTWIAE